MLIPDVFNVDKIRELKSFKRGENKVIFNAQFRLKMN